MKKFNIWLCLGLIITSSFSHAITLKIAMLAKGETQNIAICVLQQAYKNINIDTSFHGFPATRSLKFSNSGIYDDEAARIYSAKDKYSNLIPIETPVLLMQGTVFTIKHKDFVPEGFESLAPFKVIINRSILFVEKGTKNLPHVDKANNYIAPFKMLLADRGDMVVTSYLSGLSMLRQLQATSIVALKPALVKIPLYHFLHKKHAGLRPLISAELKSMDAEGEIAKIYAAYIKSLMNPNITPRFNNGDATSVPCPTT